VYSLRSYDEQLGLAQDRIGFAWAPRTSDGGPWTSDYVAQSGQLLERLASALRDSSEAPELACAPPWCTAALDGAAFTDSWETFTTWSQPGLAFASAPPSVAAGSASAPIAVELETDGVVDADTNPVTVTLATSSPQGGFATSADGPWTPTLTVTLPAGTTTSPTVYYRDTRSGTATLTAAAAGRGSTSEPATVTAAEPTSVAIAPATASVFDGAMRSFTATGIDAYGNAVPVTATWALAAGAPGMLAAGSGATTAFTAGATGSGTTTLTATAGSLTATATIVVRPAALHVPSLAEAFKRARLVVTLSARVRRATVSLAVYRGTSLYARLAGSTGANGRLSVATARKVPRGCYTTKLRSVVAAGFAWDGVTPLNRRCR
jgi:hypothetical protein